MLARIVVHQFEAEALPESAIVSDVPSPLLAKDARNGAPRLNLSVSLKMRHELEGAQLLFSVRYIILEDYYARTGRRRADRSRQ
jgi:hypothetical protein